MGNVHTRIKLQRLLASTTIDQTIDNSTVISTVRPKRSDTNSLDPDSDPAGNGSRFRASSLG